MESLNLQIQYKLIEELTKINDKLNDEIRKKEEVETNLIQTNKKLEDALKIKSEFLSNMSHELRTPLNIIIGYLQIIDKRDGNSFTSKEINSIRFASDDLLHIVNQILDFSKLESKSSVLKAEPFSLKDFIYNFENIYKDRFLKENINFKVLYQEGMPDKIISDSKKIGQILFNLLGNAFKFTSEGEVILKCSINAVNTEEENLILEVADTGKGISKNDLVNIFDRFKQVQDGIDREFGGTGLGLTITKELINVLKGRISVESKEGVGSCFKVEIPFSRINEEDCVQHEQSDSVIEKDLTQISVLIVDDFEMNRELAGFLLDSFGCNYDMASDGFEAVSLTKQNNYDMILMDLHMPRLNGYDAAIQIREFNSSTKIIGFTADVVGDVEKQVLAVGMNGLISKPFDINEFKVLLNQIE